MKVLHEEITMSDTFSHSDSQHSLFSSFNRDLIF